MSLAYDFPDNATYFARSGKQWTDAEKAIVRNNRHMRTDDLVKLLPGRSRHSVQSWRVNNDLGFKQPKVWTATEDAIIRECYLRNEGATAVHRSLPHRTTWDIDQRAKQLRLQYTRRDIKVIGHPIVDAIRRRAREDGLSMRKLDRELGGCFFTNDAALRVRNGHRMDWNKINQALDFFDARLVTAPDGSQQIDWQDE